VIDRTSTGPSTWKEEHAGGPRLGFWNLVLTAEADFLAGEHDVFQRQINYKVAASGPALTRTGPSGTTA